MFSMNSVNYSSRWGASFSQWGNAYEPKVSVPVFVNKEGKATLEITSAGYEYLLRSKSDQIWLFVYEQLNDYELLEYNKALFKYSGGTNKEALANTIRKDFK